MLFAGCRQIKYTGPNIVNSIRVSGRNRELKQPGGSTPLYKLYRYVPPHRVGFLRRFGLKTGIHFAHFGLESGMVFEGTTEYMHVFIVSIPNEQESWREICEFNMDLNNFFVCALI